MLRFILFLGFICMFFPHDLTHSSTREWILNDRLLEARFIQYQDNVVWLMNNKNTLQKIPISNFSKADQSYILSTYKTILSLNNFNSKNIHFNTLLLFSVICIVLILFVKRKQIIGPLIVGFFILACSNSVSNSAGDDVNDIPKNNIEFMKNVFEKFTGVTTSNDDTYFFVSSNGIPAHNMMVGITNWQQQVPIDHSYTSSNSWAIPLQPELTETPLSTKTNLLKGAIAIAANGIPIFNPLNNRGEDANVIGELDQWGGHCGRADDYHYHLPPTHLQDDVGEGKPIAYAVDGFPVYGQTTEELDEYLGRFNSDGSYQYHTTSTYPYFIAGMRGKVTIDPNTTAPENQVTPQATTRGVRPALTPLNGASIIRFEKVSENSYSLTYTMSSVEKKINYSWSGNNYVFKFIHLSDTITENYSR